MIVGIDIGGSTTQGVMMRNGKISSFTAIHASDAMASAAGCLGKIITENRMRIDMVTAVAATGGGAGKLNKSLLGIPVKKVEEIKAIGLGGMALTGKKKCFVVSIGTGTAMVAVTDGGKVIKHVGGTGVGGGTLKGLFKLLLNKDDINNLELLAEKGNIKKINLTVRDIVGKGIGEISAEATAANFGKLSDDTSEHDIALGLINMVGEVVGTLSTFAARNHGLEKDIVFIGKVTRNKMLMKKLQDAVRTFGGRAVVPSHAEFATAIGAAKALTSSENSSFLEKLRKRVEPRRGNHHKNGKRKKSK
jgi:type II pantothenate kinase